MLVLNWDYAAGPTNVHTLHVGKHTNIWDVITGCAVPVNVGETVTLPPGVYRVGNIQEAIGHDHMIVVKVGSVVTFTLQGAADYGPHGGFGYGVLRQVSPALPNPPVHA